MGALRIVFNCTCTGLDPSVLNDPLGQGHRCPSHAAAVRAGGAVRDSAAGAGGGDAAGELVPAAAVLGEAGRHLRRNSSACGVLALNLNSVFS